MDVIQICMKVKRKIDKDEKLKGQVHSVFSRSCNIITSDDELITILSYKKSMAPMSILIKLDSFKKLEIMQGMEVRFSKKFIWFDELNLNLDISKAKIFDPKVDFEYLRASEREVYKRLSNFEDCIYKYGKVEGVAPLIFNLGGYFENLSTFLYRKIPLNQYGVFIINRFVNFINLVIKNDIRDISEATKQIIGFGPGLTPAIDDFISGLMISFVYLSDYFRLDITKIYGLNSEIIKEINNRTTKISEEILKHSSVGEASETVKKFIISILSHSTEEEFFKRLMDVLEYGDTSGTDILCGIYIGFRIMFNDENRRLLTYGS